MLSGPMFEPAEDEFFRSIHGKRGGHYNTFAAKPGTEMASLRHFFPEGEADSMNFVLFSTSGIHGSYATLEDVEASLKKYGDDARFPDGDEPDDWCQDLTFIIVQPRLCTTRHGNVTVRLADVPFLKKLRASSWAAVATIGKPEEP